MTEDILSKMKIYIKGRIDDIDTKISENYRDFASGRPSTPVEVLESREKRMKTERVVYVEILDKIDEFSQLQSPSIQ